MMTTNEILHDRLLKHTVYLMRLIYRQQDDALFAITKGNPKLAYWVQENYDLMSGLSGLTKSNQVKWGKLRSSLFKLRSEVFDGFKEKYSSELLRTIDAETKYLSVLVNEAVGIKEFSSVLPSVQAENILNYGAVDGNVFSEWFTKVQEGDVDRIISTVRSGIISKKSYSAITTELLGTKKLNYADGIIQGTRNGTKTMVRTLSMGIINNAREEFVQANSDIIEFEIFTATLDGRTTIECAGLDQTRFRIGQGDFPPLHRNCRSIRVPEIAGIRLLGERPYITDTRTPRERRIDFRADAKAKVGVSEWKNLTEKDRLKLIQNERVAWANANIGRVPSSMSYNEWLGKQSASFQNEVLGRKGGELFRTGELQMSKFADLSGHKYTVDELYGLYSDLFAKYNISYP